VRGVRLILILGIFALQALDLQSLAGLLAGGKATHGCAEKCSPGESSTEGCSSQCPCPCAPHGTPVILPPARRLIVEHVPVLASSSIVLEPNSEAHPRSIFHPPATR
jgi:hypothetical protein